MKPIRALFWGNRVGKTEWGAMEVVEVLLGTHPFIAQGDIWSFCPSYDEQKDTTQKKLLQYIPEGMIDEAKSTWVRKGIYKEIHLKTGQKVTFKSYEQGREKAQGAGKTMIWFDEEPSKEIFEECFVRQEAGVDLFIIMTMTPVKGMTWVYDDIYLNTKNPDIFVSTAGWDDNPHLEKKQKAQMERGLSAQALKVRRDGKFVKMVGLVCSWFNRDIHVIDMKEIPEGETYMGIDFGFSAPCACLWVRIDREFNWWIFEGFYRKGLITPEIAKLIRQKEGRIPRVTRIADSAQAADIEQLNDSGIVIEGVSKTTGTTKENWDQYRARLMETQGRVQELTGKPKVFISKDLTDLNSEGIPYNFLVKEIENLRWEEVKTSAGIEQKPVWGKQPNHAVDALTYIMTTIDEPTEHKEQVEEKGELTTMAEQMDKLWD